MNSKSNIKFKHVFSHPSRWENLKKIIRKPFNKKDPKQYIIYNQLIKNLAILFKNDKTDSYTDHQVFTFVYEFMNEYYYPIYGPPNNESESRAMARVIDIQDIYFQIKGSQKPQSYLDVGCSSGIITSILSTSLKIPAAHAIDIIDINNLYNVEYTRVLQNTCLLPYSDNQFDFVTCIMSLHHIRNADSYIKEIYRCLKPGGIVIIQEHDAQSFDDFIFLDILHGLYSISWCKTGEQENPEFCVNYEASYLSKKNLNNMFKRNGFSRVDIVEKKYESIPWNNLFRNYWIAYMVPHHIAPTQGSI